MIKTIAYYPVHYGAEYIAASIKSIEPFVDKIIILYTKDPSYGFGTSMQCPESEEEIKNEAFSVSDKIEWVNLNGSRNESDHRGNIMRYTSGYDVLLAMDTDEVWNQESLERCINETYNGTSWRRNVLGFVNFWRSFDWACYDGFQPARLFKINAGNTIEEPINGTIYHFGYAQSDKIMNYKFEIHGHKNELKPGWLQNTYYTWEPGKKDLHPVCDVWGEAVPFDKNTLPGYLKEHLNFNKSIIS